MSVETKKLTVKDFTSDQEIRWCPGCGDFAILKQVQMVMPELGIPKEDFVVISGIGCSSRFPYYMNTYGMHTIHGRATAIASGLKAARPDLSVWIVTGDGDSLSIGGNHLIHLLRRNFDVNILLFNNEIYGLTKGQYSPTSPQGTTNKTAPLGSIDYPFNPLALALGADATFVARSMDREAKHLKQLLHRSHGHKGASLLEVYQNCHVFNDGAFDAFSDKKAQKENAVFLEQGQPLVFGAEQDKGIVLDGYKPKLVSLTEGYSKNDLWIHDEQDLGKAMLLTRFFDDPSEPGALPRPFGVLYDIEKTTYDDGLAYQLQQAIDQQGEGDLQALINGAQTWEVN